MSEEQTSVSIGLPVVDPEAFGLTEEQARIRELAAEVVALRADVDTIVEHMHEAAVDHDFCKMYDEVVDALNDKLTVVQIPPRRVQYLVRLTVSGPPDTNWDAIVSRAFDRLLDQHFGAAEMFDTLGVDWEVES